MKKFTLLIKTVVKYTKLWDNITTMWDCDVVVASYSRIL